MSPDLVASVRLVHLIAVALAVGAATAKNLLLFRCRKDISFVPTFLKVEGPITKQIILGQILLTLTGVSYALLLKYGFTPRIIIKATLLLALWALGPTIDNVVSPRFRNAVPAAGNAPTPEFVQALDRYLFWDVTANVIFYVIIIFWVLTG